MGAGVRLNGPAAQGVHLCINLELTDPDEQLVVAARVGRVLPAVVNVTTDMFQMGQTGQGVGTGFVVRADGIVVTNCHVVENASKITVFSSDQDPKKYDAYSRQLNAMHFDLMPQVPLWQPSQDAVMAPSIEGYTYQFHRQVDFRDLSRK